ncbi:DUF3017 domain-containing protein [Microlunatus elymi]|uniref:DUF3017 domain-containing protein n=2 Tax=Microlunatus elymi TaxID=2596828 RepID=A0A516Q5B2_9ACTN|nr:DUF3017 domain-containing protein [Microlunatus elymi]
MVSLAVVVAGMIAGLVLVAIGQWRLGCLVVGAFLAVGGLERLLLPTAKAGLLRVRSRFFDVIILIGMGAAIIALSILVPQN